MLTKLKYSVLYIVAVIEGASPLEKADIQTKMSLSQFEAVKRSLKKTQASILRSVSGITTQVKKNHITIEALKDSNKSLEDTREQLLDKVGSLEDRIEKVDNIL